MTFPTSFPTPGMSAEHVATLYTERTTSTSRISELPRDIVDYIIAPFSQIEAPIVLTESFILLDQCHHGPMPSTDDKMGALFSINW